MSTQDFGTCPHCAARVELGAQAGPGRCASCGGLYLPVVPEAEGAGSSATEARARERVLLPQHAALDGATRGVRAWLDARGLVRPLLAWTLAAGLGLVALSAAGLGAALLEPGPETRRTLGRVVAVLLLPFSLPLIALPAALAVRLLFGRRRPDGARAFWRSLIALTLGIAVGSGGTNLAHVALAAWLGRGWSAALLAYALGCLAAGWLVARVASEQPYRHALGVGLVFVLGLALVLVPFGWRASVAVLPYFALVPALWLGVWLRVRAAV